MVNFSQEAQSIVPNGGPPAAPDDPDPNPPSQARYFNLDPKVNRLALPLVGRRRSSDATRQGFWHRLAIWVMRRPVAVLVPSLAFLVIADPPTTFEQWASGQRQPPAAPTDPSHLPDGTLNYEHR